MDGLDSAMCQKNPREGTWMTLFERLNDNKEKIRNNCLLP